MPILLGIHHVSEAYLVVVISVIKVRSCVGAISCDIHIWVTLSIFPRSSNCNNSLYDSAMSVVFPSWDRVHQVLRHVVNLGGVAYFAGLRGLLFLMRSSETLGICFQRLFKSPQKLLYISTMICIENDQLTSSSERRSWISSRLW